MTPDDTVLASATALRHGIERHHQGRLPEAEQFYRRALQIDPANAEALHLLGVLAGQIGRTEAAIELISRALAAQPANPTYLNNLANALRDAGRDDEAEQRYRAAIALHPAYVEAIANLGKLLQRADRRSEAKACYDRALELQEAQPEAHNNLGTLWHESGRAEKAEPCYRRAIALKPDYVDAHLNLGEALRTLGRLAEAEASFRNALALQPRLADAHNRLANVLRTMARQEEAEASYRVALDLDPSRAEAHSNLVFLLNYIHGRTPEEIFAEHRSFARRFCSAPPPAPFGNPRKPERKLRVGYVSGDLRDHPVAFFIEPVLAHHDRGRFEVFCYHNFARGDATTERLKAHGAHWRVVDKLDDSAFERLVREDAIDILVDLSGHTGHTRIVAFGRRLAPVQACWLGYLNTTGLETMDYRITDAHASPPGRLDALHTEKLVRLPGSQWCYRPPADSPDVAPPPFASSGAITFATFTNAAKVGVPMLRLWGKLLAAVPHARLLVAGAALATIPKDLIERFTREGIPESRLRIIPAKPFREYLELHASADIILDTHPYSGGTTSCHALWMGVPVITLAGDTATSRGGASLLNAVGLPDLVAESDDAYLAIASKLAADTARIASLRTGMRARMRASALMDEPGFTRHLEQAYRAMWANWCESTETVGPSPG